jgi:tetratricopeptide (TPR) repeat protein
MRIRYAILFLFITFSSIGYSENTTIDSLLHLISIEKDDSILVNVYNKIGSISNREDEVLAKEYWGKALALAEENIKKKSTLHFLQNLSNASNGMGIMSKRSGDLPGAISFYQKSLKINEELDDTSEIATNYYKIGVVYLNLKEYETCFEYYNKSLKLKELLNDTSEIIKGFLSISVVCNNALDRAVNDFKLLDPAKILDKTAELVIEAFKVNDKEDVKDGMDISLCSFDMKNNKLEFAGAINSIYHIKNDSLIEIKGDKQPIGQFQNLKPFTTHKIRLAKGDKIYMFSDGYADQFGGEKGKKFMYRRYRDFILSISNKDFLSQQLALKNEFNSWKGDLEQLDDVCVIGLKV